MGKNLLLRLCIMAIAILSICTQSNAQTFTATTPFEEVDVYDDTLKYWIYNVPGNAWGDVNVTVYYEGDFGDNYEYIDFYAGNTQFVGRIGGSTLGDCNGVDTARFTFPLSVIGSSLPADSILIIGLPNADVDPGACNISHAAIILSFKYCAQGAPQIADFTVPANGICATEILNLVGTPANGTFSGTGVTGNTFNPAALCHGTYNITYTATDNIGCTTNTTKSVTVLPTPTIENVVACPGTSAQLQAGGYNDFVWYSNSTLTTALDTTYSSAYTTAPLYNTSNYYVTGLNYTYTFAVDTILDSNSSIIDHDMVTGDDNGGIAVTPNYVFVVGDDYSARYNLDLTNPVQLPRRDGLFSDLGTGKLYSLYNGTNLPLEVSAPYTINSLVQLDSNLALGCGTTPLSTSIAFDYEYNGIFAGAGFVILYSALNEHFYHINLVSGNVSDLGYWSSELQNSENWASWGVAEYNNGEYYILYRDYNDSNIHRLKISDGTITTVGEFTDISDLASFTVSPWNNRWYFHHENSGQFGGNEETLGYTDAAITKTAIAAIPSCAVEVTATVNKVNLGADTVICEGNYVVLFAGTGYTQYAWNGTTTNYNAISANEQGVYAVAVVDNDGCTLRDSVNVIVNDAPNPSIDLGGAFIYCNDAAPIALTAVPANGTFSGDGITGSSFSPATAGVGVHQITYTVTGNNGCVGSSTEYLVVDNCTGVEDLDASTINVYPNPSTGIVNVQFGNNVSDATIAVYDVQGREVYNTSSVNNNIAKLNLGQIGSGVYVLRVTSNGNISTQRLLIQQ